MSYGLLLGHDEQLAAMLFSHYNQKSYKYDRCLGIISSNKDLKGFILFHNWNGFNVELSYYGSNTLTPGIIRCIAQFVLGTFDASRMTVTVSKRKTRLLRSLQRFGFKLEGAQRCYYGKRDCRRNTGIRFVLFRDKLEKLACVSKEKVQQAC